MILGEGVDVNGTVTLNGSFSEEPAALEGDTLREMDNANLLQSMHADGIYSRVKTGSIKIRFSCVLAGSLTKLRELYETGTIDELLYEQHGRKFSERGVQSMKVNIPLIEFKKAESRALMTPEHRRLLQSAADHFAPSFTVTQQLLRELSLDKRRRQAILSQPTEEEKSRRLFDIVSRQADSAFQQLVDALRKTDNFTVANHLQPCSSRTASIMSPKIIMYPRRDDDETRKTDNEVSLGLHSLYIARCTIVYSAVLP